MLPFAPPRLSMMICCPRRGPSLLEQHARLNVRGAAGRERHDAADGFGRIRRVLRLRRRRTRSRRRAWRPGISPKRVSWMDDQTKSVKGAWIPVSHRNDERDMRRRDGLARCRHPGRAARTQIRDPERSTPMDAGSLRAQAAHASGSPEQGCSPLRCSSPGCTSHPRTGRRHRRAGDHRRRHR